VTRLKLGQQNLTNRLEMIYLLPSARTIFQLHDSENHLRFDEMMIYVLY